MENKKSSVSVTYETRDQKQKKINKILAFVVGILFVIGVCLIFYIIRSKDTAAASKIEVFNTIFCSILLQAFPFMLIGVLVSAAMHVFIPDQWIVKVFPMKYGLGFLTAMFSGLFFPICECAIVPVMARLIKKGVPMPIAITFMLSAPIINPIVIVSTLYAFPGQPKVMFMRVGFGLLIALFVGLAMAVFARKSPMLLNSAEESMCCCHCTDEEVEEHDLIECTCHSHHEEDHAETGVAGKLKRMFLHAGDEFFDVGKYLVLGAFITSLIQVLIPKNVFDSIGAQNWLALVIMMLMAFLFSACSTSDAFIARSFTNRFSMGSIMGFLVFGPMMDVKNLLMLLASFEKKFVVKLAVMIIVLNFLMLSVLNYLFL